MKILDIKLKSNPSPRRLLWVIALLLLISLPGLSQAQDTDDCLGCHDDTDLTGKFDGRKESMYVNPDKFASSVHADIECTGCHEDLDGFDDFPHDDDLAEVECANCHDDIAEMYSGSLHGEAVSAGDKMAPKCWDCHGSHDIVEASNEDSRVAKFNIPFMCGKCHKEGTEITKTHDIHQDSILSHYSLSIHGYGLFKQGLIVTAVCADCHTAHDVRDHNDPKSSIHRDNVAETCQQCHQRIKDVHKQVIEGELWEREPDQVPICVDCHEPHEIRNVFYGEVSDSDCLKCHAQKDLSTVRDGVEISLYVDTLEAKSSIHRTTTCSQCHTGVSPKNERPCSTVSVKAECVCHSETVSTYKTSTHGQLVERGDQNAPVCEDCHGRHNIKSHTDMKSPIFPTNVPKLCGSCHREGNKAAERYTGDQHNILENYVMSIHGKGLLESGLTVTAMCTDCHTAHHVLPADDPNSTVFKDNIPQTCAKCHSGIWEKYRESIHYSDNGDTDKQLPNCDDCHVAHTVQRIDKAGFKTEMVAQCGRCHEEVTESYFETFHGKVSKLGYDATARCYDCHGAHNVLPSSDPNSTLSRDNIVETCGQCHPGSHTQFTGYLTHATHKDRDKYPILFYTFWFMMTLLVSTLIVAGIHTLMWLPRSFQMMKEHKAMRKKHKGALEYQRFRPFQRRLHIMIVVSFLGLAMTGMTLKFSYLAWAQFISSLMGGFETVGYIHRLCAVITFTYFLSHIYFLFVQKREAKQSWAQFLLDEDSMIPSMNDAKDAWATLKWFVGAGPRPQYGRWTYWEKFDYFAVFWGVAIIGFTGLMLWFPEFFTRFLPGWIINVATIIHSDEALLATAFIFTVHFFNTHFRPDKFPMDTVIFTGRMSVEELKLERPREYEKLMKDGKLKEHLVQPLPEPIIKGMRVFGTIALTIGLTIIILIIYAELFG